MKHRSNQRRRSFVAAVVGLAIAFAIAGVESACDPYDCTSVPCSKGTWQRCIACSGDIDTTCTYEARTANGDTVHECTYAASSSPDDPARAGCYDDTNAAGNAACEMGASGTTSGGVTAGAGAGQSSGGPGSGAGGPSTGTGSSFDGG